MIYRGNSIIIRQITLNDTLLLHSWLKLANFSFYRPCLIDMCPNPSDLKERMLSISRFDPPLEIEVLIEHSLTRSLIGIMSLSGIDYFNRKAEFSIGFARGLGTRCTMEALHFGLDRAFSVLDMRKIIFYITADNNYVLKFMTRYQMKVEGLLREELLLNTGDTLDLYRYALHLEDWKKGNLRKKLQRLVPLTN